MNNTKKWTEEEKLIAKYCKLCGYEWIARDKDEELWMFKNKPHKTPIHWTCLKYAIEIDVTLETVPHISWEDKEPTNVNDILTENNN